MDPISTVILGLTFLLPLYLLLRPNPYPSIPAVPWSEYLPTGLAYSLLTDSRRSVATLLKLVDIHGDIFQFWMGPTRAIVLTNPADLTQVLKSARHFDRPPALRFSLSTIVPHSLFTVGLDTHDRMRRDLRTLFNHSVLQSFHTGMQATIHETCSYLAAVHIRSTGDDITEFTPPIDINAVLSALTFRAIVNVVFASDWDTTYRQHMSKVTDDLLDALLAEVMGYPLRAAAQLLGYRNHLMDTSCTLRAACRQFVDTRRAETAEQRAARPSDALDALIKGDRSDDDDEDAVAATSQVMAFLVAGAHTTNQTLCWLLYEVLQKPHIVAHIHEELAAVQATKEQAGPFAFDDVDNLAYVRKVWKETLRMHPPGGVFYRQALSDVTLNGSQISVRKGTILALLPQRTHLDERYWNHGTEFDPERWGSGDAPGPGDRVPPGAYLPFSVGARNCAGQAFADYEGVLVVAELFRLFDLQLGCEPEDIVATTSWVKVARYVSPTDKTMKEGIPIRVRIR